LIAMTLFAAVGGLAPSAEAQAAHFSYAQAYVNIHFDVLTGIAVDGSGNVFVTDQGAVYEIPPLGGYATFRTILDLTDLFGGPLPPNYLVISGIAVDGNGDVFLCTSGTAGGIVLEIPAAAGPPVTLPFGPFSQPMSIAADGSGNLFVGDHMALYEIPAAGGYTTISIIYGGPLIGTNGIGVASVAVDGSGNVFFSAQAPNTPSLNPQSNVYEIPKADLALGFEILTTVDGLVIGMAADGSGNVFFVTESESGVAVVGEVYEIPAAGGPIKLLAGTFGYPSAIAVDRSDNVFLASVPEAGDGLVTKLETASVDFSTVAVGQTSGSIPLTFTFDTAGTLGNTAVLTQGAQGLDFTDHGTGTCLAGTYYNAGDTCTIDVQFTPTRSGARYGAAVLYNTSGTRIATGYVFGTGSGPEVNFSPGTQTTLGSGFANPFGLAVDGAGNVFVADTNNNAVKEILAAGGYTAVSTLGSGFNGPQGVAVDGGGNVFVTDSGNNAVKMVSPGCTSSSCVQTLGSGFANPFGLAVDGGGNVFVADSGNNAVKEIPAAGGYTAVSTLGSGFNRPQGVAVDGNGNVFVTDSGNNAVKEIPAAGSYTAVSTLGSGFNGPQGLAVDGNGNVFVADLGNNAVKKLDFADAPSLTFASTQLGSTSNDSPQTVTIQNIGNQPLNAGLVVTGPNFVQVAGSGTPEDCTSSFALTPGAACNLSLSFEPQSGGTLTSTAVLTDNALNASSSPANTQTITLSGSGTGTQGSQTITFTNSAPTSAAYNSQFTVAATASSGLGVTFTSSGSCTNSGATYTMTSGTGTCSVIANQAGNGNYSVAPQVTQTTNATPAAQTITFTTNAPTSAGYNSQFTVVATASSGLGVTFTSSGSCTNSGATYTMTGGTGACSVVANQAGNANYSAAPQVTQTTNATPAVQTITFTTNAPTSAAYNSQFTVAATASSSLGVTFTSSGSCTNSGATYTMTSGTGACSVIANQTGSSNYSAAPTVTQTTNATPATPVITWTPASIQLGYPLGPAQLDATASVSGTFTYTPLSGTAIMSTSKTLSVLFTPTDTRDYTTASMSVSLTVTPGPLASVSPSSINFGTLYLGAVVTQNVTVTNVGNAPMTITDPLFSIVHGGNSNEFGAVNLCPKSLAAGKNCTIIVGFVAGPYYTPQTATLSIKDNAPGNPQTVTLSATVINPQASFNPTSLSFGTQTVNTSVTKAVTLKNTGATTLSNISVTVTGTNAAEFTLTPSSTCASSLAAGSSCTINVTFKPVAKVSYSATLQVTDNTQSGKQTVPLSGTGH